jgi:hippurate hydrolase
VDPEKMKSGEPLPYLHSSKFAPSPQLALKTGIRAMTTAVLELMKK